MYFGFKWTRSSTSFLESHRALTLMDRRKTRWFRWGHTFQNRSQLQLSSEVTRYNRLSPPDFWSFDTCTREEKWGWGKRGEWRWWQRTLNCNGDRCWRWEEETTMVRDEQYGHWEYCSFCFSRSKLSWTNNLLFFKYIFSLFKNFHLLIFSNIRSNSNIFSLLIF